MAAGALSAGAREEVAPPKQLANALDALNRAVRLIAEVRVADDRLMEAVSEASWMRSKQQEEEEQQEENVSTSSKAMELVSKAAERTRSVLEELRSTGKQLQLAGVLVAAEQRYADNQPWGLQLPLVCPDGAVVAYSWKRQIAGQAAASAVDRTRLALNAFAQQKKKLKLFVERDDDPLEQQQQQAQTDSFKKLSLGEVLKQVQTHAAGMVVTPYPRFCNRKGTPSSPDKAGVLEVVIPGVLRAVVSLLPPPVSLPDAVAVFSPDEMEQQVDAWEESTHNVYRKLSACARSALYHFTRAGGDGSGLLLFLQWLYSYRSLFTTPCRQCKRILALDPSSSLLLPPVIRPFALRKGGSDEGAVYHLGCTK